MGPAYADKTYPLDPPRVRAFVGAYERAGESVQALARGYDVGLLKSSRRPPNTPRAVLEPTPPSGPLCATPKRANGRFSGMRKTFELALLNQTECMVPMKVITYSGNKLPPFKYFPEYLVTFTGIRKNVCETSLY